MKKSALLLLMLAVCLLASACGVKEPVPTAESTAAPIVFDIGDIAFTKKQVILTEAKNGLGAPYSLNKDLEIGSFQGTEYAFEPEISSDDREACIRITEGILRRVGLEKRLRIHIYTAETYEYTFVEDGAVYTCLRDWYEPEYTVVLLQGLFGEFCHYGALYGYASHLGNVLFNRPVNVCGENWVFEGNADVLDMNVLCFRNGFFDGKDVKAAKRLANTFVQDYIEKNGESSFQTILIQSGEPDGIQALVTALMNFYVSIDLNHTPTDLIFCQGGKGYDYIVKSQCAIMYMERDWQDRNPAQLPMYYEGYLHRNYSQIIEYFTSVSREMSQYQTLFGLDSYRNDLKIYYTNQYKNGKSAWYVPNEHAISSPYCDMMRCYIESLISGIVSSNSWGYTGITTYFYWYYNHYGCRDMNYVANLESDHDALQIYREFRKWLGREIDMRTDFADFCHYYASTKDNQDPNQGNSDSFVGYLISRFGEKQVIEVLLNSQDFEGVTFEELVAGWKLFLKESYKQ